MSGEFRVAGGLLTKCPLWETAWLGIPRLACGGSLGASSGEIGKNVRHGAVRYVAVGSQKVYLLASSYFSHISYFGVIFENPSFQVSFLVLLAHFLLRIKTHLKLASASPSFSQTTA